MDPVGPWSTYASYNRLASVQTGTTGGELHHHLPPGSSSVPPATTAQILPGSFLSPPPVGYESVFSPLFHHASAKPTSHYVTQHRQALQAAVSKQSDGEYHQAQTFFEQNPGAWQQNGPFGVLPHETVVPSATPKTYESFNAHFAAQSINHLNSLAVKNASIRAQSPHVQTNTANTKNQTNPLFFQSPTAETSTTSNKLYPTSNAQAVQQSCIVTPSNTDNVTSKDYRIPQTNLRPGFPTNAGQVEKVFATSCVKQTPQIQTKAQTKIYSDLGANADRHRTNEKSNQQNSPISFSIMDAARLNYTNNNGNKRVPSNYRHYPQNNEGDFQQRNKDFTATNGSDCNVVVPRRPSPLQAHSQASPLGHATSPAYPMYNSPMNSAVSSPQNANTHVTPSSPLDASVPRPNSQTTVGYPSVITRALNTEKNFTERFERHNQSQNCWEDRRKFNNNYNMGNNAEVSSRLAEVSNNSQVALQDLSSCRGDPMTIVKNLQQQQSFQSQHPEVKQEVKPVIKRRKSNEKPILIPTNEIPGRIPPPAHSSATNQQPQNGAYFDFDRWNLPPPTKIFPSQPLQQHQGLMVPHPHSHHAPIPYFPPFHIPPHPTEYTSNTVEITPLATSFTEQNVTSQTNSSTEYQEPQEEQPKVVVPNIEEELNFLSVPPQVTKPILKPQSNIPPLIVKPPESKKANTGFMSSYLKFLQGERDSSPPPVTRGGRKQTWIRPVSETTAEVNGTATAIEKPQPQPRTPARTIKQTQGDPQDDPRYFPLPKERKQDKFDSDDGISSDDDLFNKKVINQKESSGKDKPAKKGRPCKLGGPTEKKRLKQQVKFKKDAGKANSKELDIIPRRELSKRAAKEKVKAASRAEDDSDGQNEFIDSDSDPAWTPAAKEDGDEEEPLKKPRRGRPPSKKKPIRNLITAAAEEAGINELDGCDSKKQKGINKIIKQGNTAPTLEDNIAAAVAKQRNSICVTSGHEEHSYKPGEFVVIKSELDQQWPAIWRVDGKTLLQKYEPFQQDGATFYRNISTYTSWTAENKNQYITVPVKYRSQNSIETIVEFMRNQLIIIDTAVKERIMKEHEVYQDNFEVYVQTLISQALDSNFLTEIFQEQDEYFLSNVKTIDDATTTKKQNFMNVLRWPTALNIALSTWPCYNIIKDFTNDLLSKCCMGCGLAGVAVRVLMYGQPYNTTTLEGCPPNPRITYEKDFVLCRICANRVELYNKVAHQKYLMYIHCAKRVAEKRTMDPKKDTTCILNELLADEKWLGQLFLDVRNYWAEIDYIVCYLAKNFQLNQ